MSDVFYIKQGDQAPAIGCLLQYADGTAQDLTGPLVVRFSMRLKGSTTPKVNAQTATVVTPLTGEVRYTWGATDTDTVGTYQAEFVVTLVDGRTVTFPNDGYLLVEVTDDVA